MNKNYDDSFSKVWYQFIHKNKLDLQNNYLCEKFCVLPKYWIDAIMVKIFWSSQYKNEYEKVFWTEIVL